MIKSRPYYKQLQCLKQGEIKEHVAINQDEVYYILRVVYFFR